MGEKGARKALDVRQPCALSSLSWPAVNAGSVHLHLDRLRHTCHALYTHNTRMNQFTHTGHTLFPKGSGCEIPRLNLELGEKQRLG